MRLRHEEPADHGAVRWLHRAAFPHEGTVVADLVDSLRGLLVPGRGLSLLAEEDGVVVGHVMFTPSLLDAHRRLVDVQVLSPLGVLPAWQGQGVGGLLVRRGLDLVAAQGSPLVFVEGSPIYYGRFGFAPGAGQGFRKPSLRIPDAAFQALRLSGYEPWMSGTLVYSEVFWRHDAVGLRTPEL